MKKVKFTGFKPSPLIALLVLLIHLLAIGLLLHDRAATSARHNERLLQIRLLPAATLTPVNFAKSSLAPYRAPPSTAITLQPLPPLAIDIDAVAARVERAGPSDPGLFDPRLRKKLSDIGSRREAQPIQELQSWTDASGTQIVEVKPGECIRSMPGDANARGDNWSLRFKCGKNAGERMMDNINADMAERKRMR